MGEFTLMSGLRFVGDLDKSRLKTNDESFKEYYFKDYEKLTKGDLETAFLLISFRSDEEAVNMVALYFNNNFFFFFFKDKGKFVDDVDMQICASDGFDDYP